MVTIRMSPARRIDGNEIAGKLRGEIAERATALRGQGIVPGLGVVLVGEDPASISYVTGKERACAENGIESYEHRLPDTISEAELLALVHAMNEDPKIHGILVQLPLPKQIDEKKILRAIAPEKDVDGFHPVNVGALLTEEECFIPCTPHGVLKMLEHIGVSPAGKHVVVVGRSNIVGKPLANLFLHRAGYGNATVTVCHSRTQDLGNFTRQADILVAAVGQAELIKADMVKAGAVVIDVGMNRIPDATRVKGFRLVGDVDFPAVSQVASAITPVPGGVGPLTITMLLHNTVSAAARLNGKEA